MYLDGQGAHRRHGERGYAMAVLLVGMSVMAILMSAALPVWRQQAQREKEEEYLWRANQYVRAITLFGRKRASAMPNSVDELISSNNERYLRKKYKDPITNEDFEILRQSAVASLPGQIGGQPQRGGQPGAAQPGSPSPGQRGQPGSTFGSGQTFGGGPIIGVVSKSKAQSVRIYKGRTHYNEWIVTTADYRSPLGGAAGQRGQPGQPGVPGVPGMPPGRGDRPGAPGVPTFPPGRGVGPRGGQPVGPGGQPIPFPMPPGRGRGGM